MLSEFVDSMCEDDSKLIIVPDAGSGDSKECKKLIESGKDIIILDHHSIDASDNPAIVVNNQLSDKITDKAMTGVGITYKQSMYQMTKSPTYPSASRCI